MRRATGGATTPIASLGMYDFPWLQGENDRLWQAVRLRLGLEDWPAGLDRGRKLEAILRDPALLIAQTCGYPLMTALQGVVRVVATPVYDLPGCDGPRHCSFVVVREGDPARSLEDLRGRTAALNGLDSNSGMNLLRAAVAPLARQGRFFGRVVVTGAHLASLAAVKSEAADVAAVDCVTHGLAALHRPELLAGTRILQATARSPGLPLVTAAATSDGMLERLRDAVRACLPWAPLALSGIAALDLAEYDAVLALERAAVERGYPALA